MSIVFYLNHFPCIAPQLTNTAIQEMCLKVVYIIPFLNHQYCIFMYTCNYWFIVVRFVLVLFYMMAVMGKY